MNFLCFFEVYFIINNFVQLLIDNKVCIFDYENSIRLPVDYMFDM